MNQCSHFFHLIFSQYCVQHVFVLFQIAALDVVWDIADILNALMAIPNLIAVLLLSPVIVKETKKYLDNLDAKDDTEIPVIKK